jgi:alkylresorcinol/alkylpyrone synthase
LREFPGSQVLAVRGGLAPHQHSQDELADAVQEMIRRDPSCRISDAVVRRTFARAGVRTRHTTMPLGYYLRRRTVAEALADQREAVLNLGTAEVSDALEGAGLRPDEVDMLAATSHTVTGGPSFDIELAARLGLRPDVRHLSLASSGCSGGAGLLSWMHTYLTAHPRDLAVGFVADLPWFCVGLAPLGMSRLVELALVGDGGAVIVMAGALRAAPGQVAPWVTGSCRATWPGSRDVVSWRLHEQQLLTTLTPRTVEAAGQVTPAVVGRLLAPRALDVGDVGVWAVHPGSLKILQRTAQSLGIKEDAVAGSRRVLARAGNIAGATVLHVLQEAGQSPRPAGTWGILTALGPGLVCEASLLHWESQPALQGSQ